MRKSDLIASLFVGFFVGVFAIFIVRNLRISIPFLALAPVFLALLSGAGIAVASLLARWAPILFQAAKFALVGTLNTMVDLGVLNFLIFVSGTAAGLPFSVFKATSFLVSVTNSYFWNKFWTFRDTQRVGIFEFGQFLAIAGGGFIINVGVASIVVNIIGPPPGLSENLWANIGAVIATLTAMTWNFLGYKLIVFRR